MKPKVSIIVAMDSMGGIGKNGGIPWNIPEDMRWFKAKTLRKPIVMGRGTHESIGRVLPGRLNVVLTGDVFYGDDNSDILVCESFEKAIHDLWSDESIVVIGGTQVYKAAIPYAERMYITRVDGDFGCDTFFPEYDKEEWQLVWYENCNNNEYEAQFQIYDLKYLDKV